MGVIQARRGVSGHYARSRGAKKVEGGCQASAHTRAALVVVHGVSGRKRRTSIRVVVASYGFKGLRMGYTGVGGTQW